MTKHSLTPGHRGPKKVSHSLATLPLLALQKHEAASRFFMRRPTAEEDRVPPSHRQARLRQPRTGRCRIFPVGVGGAENSTPKTD